MEEKRVWLEVPKFTGENVPVNVAAKIMKKDPQFVRQGIIQGLLTFGVAFKKEGSSQYDYCYGANSVPEGVAIMWKEGVDVSITGNSTNPTRFQHPVAGTYKKECIEKGKKYFSVASGGGTGRTLHPDNMAAGPASYGMTDTLGRMHSDAQFAGSSSVPAHVEMMGLIGAGNNPMVGMTVAVAVSLEEAAKEGKF